MNSGDPVLQALGALPVPPLDRGRAEAVRAAAIGRLRPRPLHPAWAFLVVSTVLGYLGAAGFFTAHLF